MSTAHNDIQEIAYFEIFACLVSITGSDLEERQPHTALDCSMSARYFEIAGTDVCLVGRHTVPAGSALFDSTLA